MDWYGMSVLALAPSCAALQFWCRYITLSKSYLPRRCDWKDGFFINPHIHIIYYPKDSPNIRTWVPSDLPLSDQCAPLRLSSPYSMKTNQFAASFWSRKTQIGTSCTDWKLKFDRAHVSQFSLEASRLRFLVVGFANASWADAKVDSKTQEKMNMEHWTTEWIHKYRDFTEYFTHLCFSFPVWFTFHGCFVFALYPVLNV